MGEKDERREDRCGPRRWAMGFAIRGAASRADHLAGPEPPGWTQWRTDTSPAPGAAHPSRCPGSWAVRRRSSQSALSRGSHPAPCAHLAASSPAADPGPIDTHTPSLLPRAPTRLLCPRRHHLRLGAQAGLWKPEVVAGTPSQVAENKGRGRRAPPQGRGAWCQVIRGY